MNVGFCPNGEQKPSDPRTVIIMGEYWGVIGEGGWGKKLWSWLWKLGYLLTGSLGEGQWAWPEEAAHPELKALWG